jgi:nicotinamidase-related amidase
VDHSRSSAFFGSDLLTILIGPGIDTVALSGIATNVAVDHTARDAMQLGFRTLLIEDCCFSSDPEHHKAALVTLRVLCSGVITSREFAHLLQQAHAVDRVGDPQPGGGSAAPL